MQLLFNLLDMIFEGVSILFALRMLFQFCRIDFYNPISQSLAKFTNPIITPLQNIFPTVKRVNTATLFVIFLIGALKVFLIFLLNQSLNTEDYIACLIVGALHIISICGKTLLYLLFIGAISSWFAQGRNSWQYILYQLTEPFLKPIRRILPTLGVIDFSPMVLAFILIGINNILADYLGLYWYLA